MFAATHPDRVIALAFWSTMARTAWAPDYPWGLRADEMRSIDELTHGGWGMEEHASEIMRISGAPPVVYEEPDGHQMGHEGDALHGSTG